MPCRSLQCFGVWSRVYISAFSLFFFWLYDFTTQLKTNMLLRSCYASVFTLRLRETPQILLLNGTVISTPRCRGMSARRSQRLISIIRGGLLRLVPRRAWDGGSAAILVSRETRNAMPRCMPALHDESFLVHDLIDDCFRCRGLLLIDRLAVLNWRPRKQSFLVVRYFFPYVGLHFDTKHNDARPFAANTDDNSNNSGLLNLQCAVYPPKR